MQGGGGGGEAGTQCRSRPAGRLLKVGRLNVSERSESAHKAAAAARPPSPASGSRKYDTVQHKAIVMQLLATPGKERELEDYMRTHADKFKPDFVAAVERGDSGEVERLAKQPGN